MRPEFVWSEKYRPQVVADCVLPVTIKKSFQAFVDQKEFPNLLLSGAPGVGKTTIAKAMLKQLDKDYTIINASKEGNIDTLRTKMQGYASSVSFKGGRKYIVLDEADYLTHATQPALRNFMEEFSRNCGFILTANYLNKIIEPLQSRCSCIDFHIAKEEKPKIASLFLHRLKHILRQENVEFQQEPLVALILKYFPDFRRTLNELQRYANTYGKIDEDIFQASTTIPELVGFMKEKNFTKVRSWVAENLNNDAGLLFRQFYNEASKLFTPDYIPMLVLTLAKYQFQAALCLDSEINFSACMAEVMVEASWK
ncbi:MAG TPA: AAA family ATPase [Methylomirabilota bacterium]|nr:AAA family ATPase [Methylomirabilota bacterium]